MPSIDFLVVLPYSSLPGYGLLPLLDVTLVLGRNRTKIRGLLDSGAHASVFGLDVAESLGIFDVSEGRFATARTMAGPFDFYLFDLEMEVQFAQFHRRFPAQVGFSSARRSRSLLGRNLIFAHFVIAFSEIRQEIYLRPQDEE